MFAILRDFSQQLWNLALLKTKGRFQFILDEV